MPGTFGTINTALRGMRAQQLALDTASNNIANANTPGYSRQEAVMATTAPLELPRGGQLGTGVDVVNVRRLRDEFLDNQLRGQLTLQGGWESRADFLRQVEVVFLEPSDSGLATIFGEFWSTWQELSKYPESSPVRTTVVETAATLSQTLREDADRLDILTTDINQSVILHVQDINDLASQFDALNSQIVAFYGREANNSSSTGMPVVQPNDLLDRRDLLMEQLAKVVDFHVGEGLFGAIRIYLEDGGVLVDEDGVYELEISIPVGEDNPVVAWSAGNPLRGGETITSSDLGGGLGALFEVRDVSLKGYREDLNALAVGLAREVNARHKEGIDLYGNDGLPFFVAADGSEDINDAVDIYVNPDLRQDVGLLTAAGNTGDFSPGDGSNALQVLSLRRQRLDKVGGVLEVAAGAGTTTFDDFYKDLVARLGVDVRQAVRGVENQQVLVDQLTNRRDSISGVSLDEEMTGLIRFQRAYQASAKIITILDELLDTMINRMR